VKVAVITFGVFVLSSTDNVLTAERTFVSLSLFNILRFPMSMLANLIGQTVQLNVSNNRLKGFLAADEIDPNFVNRFDEGARGVFVCVHLFIIINFYIAVIILQLIKQHPPARLLMAHSHGAIHLIHQHCLIFVCRCREEN
jgi:hypothetical protein